MNIRNIVITSIMILASSMSLMSGEKNVTEEPVVLNPRGDVKAIVIWLHGLGADGHDFEPIVSELDLPNDHGIRFVFPHAPMRAITINGGFVMRGWYDIKDGNLSLEEDEAGIRESSKLVSELIKREMQQYSMPASRIVLAGFSQGGAIVLHTALRHPDKLAGVMALSTYVPLINSVKKERSDANSNIDIFMGHGNYDPVVPLSHAQHSRDELESLGYQVNWNSYNMEHSVVPDEIDDIGLWLRKQLID